MIEPLLTALVPIAILIALGVVLRRFAFLPDAFWPSAERLCYFILLPALFFLGMATARLDGVPTFQIALCLLVPLLAISATVVAGRPLLTSVDDPGFTSIFQGAVRFNNYAAVTAAIGVFGTAVLPIAAVATAIIVTTVNILCALVFARYGQRRGTGISSLIATIVLNPLVLACVLGTAFQLSGLTLPAAVQASVKALGQASLPLGLICVGAGLTFKAMRGRIAPVLVASAIKLVAMPLVTLASCVLFGLAATPGIIAVLFQAMPTASSSYIMARQLGGDAELMTSIIALETIFAAATVPGILLIAQTAL